MIGKYSGCAVLIFGCILISAPLSADDNGTVEEPADCGGIVSALADPETDQIEDDADAAGGVKAGCAAELASLKAAYLKAGDLKLKVRLLNQIGLSGDLEYASGLFTFVSDNTPKSEDARWTSQDTEELQNVLRSYASPELLVRYLRSADPVFREHASALLRDICGSGRACASEETLTVASDPASPGRVEAIEALSASPIAAYAYKIARFTGDTSKEVRLAAARALCYMGDDGCLRASSGLEGLCEDKVFGESGGTALHASARKLKNYYLADVCSREVGFLSRKKDADSSRRLTEIIKEGGGYWTALPEVAERGYAPAFGVVAKRLALSGDGPGCGLMTALVTLDKERGAAEVGKYKTSGRTECVAEALALAGKTQEAAELYLQVRERSYYPAEIDEKIAALGEGVEKPAAAALRAGKLPPTAFAGYGLRAAAGALWEIYGSSIADKPASVLAGLLSLKEERAKAPAIDLLNAPDSGFLPELAKAMAGSFGGDKEAVAAVLKNVERADHGNWDFEKDAAFDAVAALKDPAYHDLAVEIYRDMSTISSCEGRYRDWDWTGIGECKEERKEAFKQVAEYFSTEGGARSYEPVEEIFKSGVQVQLQLAKALNYFPGRPFSKFQELYSSCADDECRKRFISAATSIKSVEIARFLKNAFDNGGDAVKGDIRYEWEEARKLVPVLAATQLRDKDPEVRAEAAWALGAVASPLPPEKPDLAYSMLQVGYVAFYGLVGIFPPPPQGAGGLYDVPLMLAEAMSDPDPKVRAAAAEAAGFVYGYTATVGLPPLLEDGNPEVRRQALIALGRTGYSAAIPRVGALLKDPIPETRRAAAEALGAMRNKRGAQYLNAALRDKNHAVYLAALAALAGSGDGSSVKPLSDALAFRARDNAAAEAAISALGAVGGVPAAQALDSAAAKGRPGALRALGGIREPEVIGILLKYMNAEDPAVRLAVADSLASISSFGVTGPLVELAADPDRGVSLAAVAGLGAEGIEKDKALPVLLRLADSGEDELSVTAIRALGELKDPRATEPLLALLANGAEIESVADALGSIGDKRALAPLLAIKAEGHGAAAVLRAVRNLAGPDEEACVYAGKHVYSEDALIRAEALVTVGKVCKGTLIKLDDMRGLKPEDLLYSETRDGDREASLRAALALAAMGDARAFGRLEAIHRNSKGLRKAEVVSVLGGQGPAAVPLLAENLASADFYIAIESAKQLGIMGGREASEALLAAARYSASDMRLIFMEELAKLKYAPAFDAFSNFLEKGNARERVSAAAALGELGDSRALSLLRKAGASGDELLRETATAAISKIEKGPDSKS